MAEGMTIKQIAELCGVSESTVRNWIDKAAASAKIAKPSAETAKVSNEPFRFTLADTLEIVRAGGKDTLADLLASNAASAETAKVSPDTRIDRLELLVERLLNGIPAIITQTVQAVARITPPVHFQGKLALPAASNGSYFTIKGYAARLGNSVRVADAVRLGREASKISREKNYAIHQVEDEAWGRVNSYHIDVLKEVFTI